MQITANHASPEDVLALPMQPLITASYDSGSGTLTLSGTASVAAYETALRAVTYRNTSSNPSTAPRTLTFLASDGAATSAPATRAINVSATDNAPDVDTSAGALAYTENDPATAIDTTITITDVDSANLTGATIQITGNYVAGEDLLALPAQPIVTASFSAATGTLTLSGTDTVAAYETALEAVTYANTSDDPTTATRTVTYTARDAGGFGASDTHGVTIAAVDDPPVAVNDSATVGEDAGATPIAVLTNDTDVDAGPKSVTSVTQPANGTVVNNGTDVSYTPNANSCNSPPGTTPDTFTYTLDAGWLERDRVGDRDVRRRPAGRGRRRLDGGRGRGRERRRRARQRHGHRRRADLGGVGDAAGERHGRQQRHGRLLHAERELLQQPAGHDARHLHVHAQRRLDRDRRDDGHVLRRSRRWRSTTRRSSPRTRVRPRSTCSRTTPTPTVGRSSCSP